MTRYYCKLRRISKVYEYAWIEVEANTEDEAQDKAIESEHISGALTGVAWKEDESETESLEVTHVRRSS
jgi:hypothetical protein